MDNPIWASLTSRHAERAIGSGRALRYPSEAAPFVAISDGSVESSQALGDLVEPGEKVGILGLIPDLTPEWQVVYDIHCHQFVFESEPEFEPSQEAVRLGPQHVSMMLDLTALVYPAYFRRETAELGPYYGVIRDGRLCAMAGIRMAFGASPAADQAAGYQEISAICTHPDFRGQGLASLLTRRLIYEIHCAGDVPFLHTEAENQAAQAMYAKLGFTLERTLPFRVMERI